VTGLATDFCVAWTALDAHKAAFETDVIEGDIDIV
jgi:nicotinamidase/pyrazinamidase